MSIHEYMQLNINQNISCDDLRTYITYTYHELREDSQLDAIALYRTSYVAMYIATHTDLVRE